MKSLDTFVVTLLRDPQRSSEPRGRVCHIASGQEITFRDLGELATLLREFSKPEAPPEPPELTICSDPK